MFINDNIVVDIIFVVGISWSLSVLIVFWIGGWVVVCFVDVVNYKVGWLYGFVVWSLVMVVMFVLFILGVGVLVIGVVKLVGKMFLVVGMVVGVVMGVVVFVVGDVF